MSSKFEFIFERSPVAMMLVDKAGTITLLNRHAEDLFQYQRSELLGKPIELLVPPQVRDRHPELVKRFFAAPLARQMGVGRNLFGVKKDQSLFPVEVALNPMEVEGQTFVLSSVIDITERLKAEEKFEAAVDAAPNGMLMIDQNRTIVLINKKIEEIFGYQRSELIGSPIEVLVPEDFRRPHPKFVENYIRKPEPRSMGIGRELFGRHKNGNLIAVEIGLQPIFTKDEIFVISSVVDITHRRSTEAEIKSKTEELEEFAYRTSHDLRSPLKSIKGLADCIEEYIEDKDYQEAIENVHKIKSLSSKLTTLVEDILVLTKVDVTSDPIKSFDFQQYVTNFQEKYLQLLHDNEVILETSFAHKKNLSIQATRLTQVLDNLLSNAVKYHNSAKEHRFARLQTFNTPEKFFIQVEDNGTGIPEDRQSEVFGMFKRFHGGSIAGSGLGLYLIKKQCAKLNATITFESTPQGTTFYLELPFSAST